MGEVKETFNLVNPKNGQSIELNALVDTGAIVSMIGRDIAEKIGLEMDSKAVVYLVGDYGIEPLIGQMVLEGLDLLVDCSRQKLSFRPNSPAYSSYKLK